MRHPGCGGAGGGKDATAEELERLAECIKQDRDLLLDYTGRGALLPPSPGSNGEPRYKRKPQDEVRRGCRSGQSSAGRLRWKVAVDVLDAAAAAGRQT